MPAAFLAALRGMVGRPVELPVSEDHPTSPLTTYHATKLWGEHLVRIAESDGIAACSMRITSPIGPGTPPGRIASVFSSNTACGEPITVLGRGTRRQNHVERCVELFGSSSEIRFSGVDPEEGVRWDVSTTRANSELGWSPIEPIDSSIDGMTEEGSAAPSYSYQRILDSFTSASSTHYLGTVLRMRILLTGARGHVGAGIAVALAQAGHEVVGLSRCASALPEFEGYVAADISDDRAVARAVEQIGRADAVVHCAACLDKSQLAAPVTLVNCVGTQSILWAARELGAPRFVNISGVPVIGAPRRTPITESHPTAPLTTYHATKLCGEHLVAAAAGAGIDGVSLRLTAPVGPGLPPNRIMSVFVANALEGRPIRLLGKGTRRQNYVDVRDVGAAVAQALVSPVSGLVNVAGAGTISNRELAELCIEELGSRSEIIHEGADPEEGLVWDVSIERARSELNWSPSLTVLDSVRALAGPRV